MKREQEHIEQMIRETVSLLCRNGLSHRVGIRIQGLLGITVDDSDVFLVQIDDSYRAVDDGSLRSSQPNGQDVPLSDDSAVESPPAKRVKRPAVSETGRPSPSVEPAVAAAAPVSFVADSDVISVADDVGETDVKRELDDLQYNNADVLPDGRDNSGDDGHGYSVLWESDVVRSADHGQAGSDLSNYDDDDENAETEFTGILVAGQNSNPDWQTQMYSYEQMTAQSIASQGNAARRHHVKQEYWNQPSHHVIPHRQRPQQQAAAGCTGEGSMVVTRSLHECGYPDCGRQFRHKQHLLRHQTKKHGRTPTRVLGTQRVWMRPGEMQGGDNINSSMTANPS